MIKLMYHHSGERSEQEPPLIADAAHEMILKVHDLLPFMELLSWNFLMHSYYYYLLVVMINCAAKNNLHRSVIVIHIIRKDDDDSDIIKVGLHSCFLCLVQRRHPQASVK
ncbi:unnamed protein product [Musa banksii]